ncbi:MAG: phage scaffolding protein [Bacillota bacterium]|jgi:hypothetical protein
MEKLKALFGDNALTWAQLEEKLKDNKEVRLANLAGGGYVDKEKLDNKVAELATANETIKGLKDTVSKFDGVDVEKLKSDAKDWETKYNTDLAAVKLDSAVSMALVEAKAKNPKLAKAALDMSVVKMDGDKLLGLSEQLESLKKSDGYLFETAEDGGNNNGGARINTGGHHEPGGGSTDPFMAAMMKAAGLEEKTKKRLSE